LGGTPAEGPPSGSRMGVGVRAGWCDRGTRVADAGGEPADATVAVVAVHVVATVAMVVLAMGVEVGTEAVVGKVREVAHAGGTGAVPMGATTTGVAEPLDAWGTAEIATVGCAGAGAAEDMPGAGGAGVRVAGAEAGGGCLAGEDEAGSPSAGAGGGGPEGSGGGVDKAGLPPVDTAVTCETRACGDEAAVSGAPFCGRTTETNGACVALPVRCDESPTRGEAGALAPFAGVTLAGRSTFGEPVADETGTVGGAMVDDDEQVVFDSL